MTDNSSSKEEDIGYVESEQLINLVVLRAARNNFSDENKLGEGGFGEVFKVHYHLYIHNEMLQHTRYIFS